MARRTVGITSSILAVLLVLSVSLLLFPLLYHLTQVGLPVQGPLHVFGGWVLVIHLLLILALTVLLVIVRRRR